MRSTIIGENSICYFAIWSLVNICKGGGEKVCKYVGENGGEFPLLLPIYHTLSNTAQLGKSAKMR